jgi:hypothetical protein
MGSDLTLHEAMVGAAEAPPSQRIEFRDPIASHGRDAIAAIEPWLRDPALAAFAIRTIVRAASFDALSQARRALAAALLNPITPTIRGDLEGALAQLGGRAGTSRAASGAKRAKSKPSAPVLKLTEGAVYRRRDLHDGGWGGNQQSGASYPANGEHVLLFSDPSVAKEHGYRDRWTPDGIYHFYGEWRGTGDMTLTGGNKAILDRSPELHLFIAAAGGQRYEGQFECVGHEPEITTRDGREFRAIVFLLKRVDHESG